MQRIFNWIKQNKLAAFLLVVVAIWIVPQVYDVVAEKRVGLMGPPELAEMALPAVEGGKMARVIPPIPSSDYPPTPEIEERLVIKYSTLSLLVKDVSRVQKEIGQKTKALGGYMVNINLSRPEEAPSGSITVRIPQEKLDEALDYFRGLAVKVVSENLYGRDVTDEYVDIETRLETLLKTKTKFEEILAKAEKVDEILQVQRELINLQTQIDNLKGRQNYLEKSVQLSKITVYLSTDELALPYAPSKAWRPKIIFKQAVRSLIRTARKAGIAIIWLGVYSVVWLPILIVFLIIHWRKRKTISQ